MSKFAPAAAAAAGHIKGYDSLCADPHRMLTIALLHLVRFYYSKT